MGLLKHLAEVLLSLHLSFADLPIEQIKELNGIEISTKDGQTGYVMNVKNMPYFVKDSTGCYVEVYDSINQFNLINKKVVLETDSFRVMRQDILFVIKK